MVIYNRTSVQLVVKVVPCLSVPRQVGEEEVQFELVKMRTLGIKEMKIEFKLRA